MYLNKFMFTDDPFCRCTCIYRRTWKPSTALYCGKKSHLTIVVFDEKFLSCTAMYYLMAGLWRGGFHVAPIFFSVWLSALDRLLSVKWCKVIRSLDGAVKRPDNMCIWQDDRLLNLPTCHFRNLSKDGWPNRETFSSLTPMTNQDIVLLTEYYAWFTSTQQLIKGKL